MELKFDHPGIWMTLSYVAFTDSESTIGSKEVGRAVEESNVMDSISVVVFDTILMQESRQMVIDFVSQLDAYCRRPRRWESFVGMLEANQLEYRSRLCEKELKRLGFDAECAMLGASPRKIRSMDASRARRMAGSVSGVAIEPQLGKQVVCQDLTGELSNSCLKYAKKRTVGKQSGDTCSSITNQSHRQLCVVVSVSCAGSCTEMTLSSSRVSMCN